MPLAQVALPFTAPTPLLVLPAAAVSSWVTVIPAGGLLIEDQPQGLELRDAAKIFDGDPAYRRILARAAGVGTTLRIRMKYAKTDPAPAAPLKIKVFANTVPDEGATPWTLLPNTLNEESAVIPTNTSTDAIWGDYAYTRVDNAAHAWDCDGYSYFLVGVQRAYPGDAPPAELEAKIV